MRQRAGLKLVLNRLVRTRMLGGVGGARCKPAPIPIVLLSRDRVSIAGREIYQCTFVDVASVHQPKMLGIRIRPI